MSKQGPELYSIHFWKVESGPRDPVAADVYVVVIKVKAGAGSSRSRRSDHSDRMCFVPHTHKNKHFVRTTLAILVGWCYEHEYAAPHFSCVCVCQLLFLLLLLLL
jgi:hypothetical protein